MDKVWIHLENATWAAGLEYVALSTVRRLDDLLIDAFSFDYLQRLGTLKSISDRKQEDIRLSQIHLKLLESLRNNK